MKTVNAQIILLIKANSEILQRISSCDMLHLSRTFYGKQGYSCIRKPEPLLTFHKRQTGKIKFKNVQAFFTFTQHPHTHTIRQTTKN